MVDILSKKQRSYCMSQIKAKNTKPEIIFRKYIWSKGIKNFIVKNRFTGKPDLVFTKKKIAVFIDGCFWHKCPKCYIKPKSNKSFWNSKIKQNLKRDAVVNKSLKSEGWNILRFWEHDTNKNINSCYKSLLKRLK